MESIARLNIVLTHEVASHLISEKVIETCWSHARRLADGGAAYWLLLIRLAEAALLCGGNYADNCEYEAAGDLLVNPRQILVHQRGARCSTVKHRHGRLTEQFAPAGIESHRIMKQLSAGLLLEITEQPLLPHMTQVLRSSGCISPAYIRRLEKGQRRIADTLAFLAAWRVFDSAQLWQRLQAVSAQESALVESHLCRFDTRIFHQIDASLQRSLTESNYSSPFLSGRHSGANPLKRTSPTAVRAFAASSA